LSWTAIKPAASEDKKMKKEEIEKKVFEKLAQLLAGDYSAKAIDLILDHYEDHIKTALCQGDAWGDYSMPSDKEIESEADCLQEVCTEYHSEAEALAACAEDSALAACAEDSALAACAEDSALEKKDDPGELDEPDRDYLDAHYGVAEAEGTFLLFSKN